MSGSTGIGPGSGGLRPPRVWMDVTTSLRHAGHHANGTLRVEREMAAALQAELGASLAFCQYRPNEQRFVAADFDPAAASADSEVSHGKPASFGATRRETPGRRLERRVRIAARALLRNTRARLASSDASALFPDASPGDVLLLGGEVWNERYDFGVISRLRRARGLKIVAICQDVIPLNHPQFFASAAFIARHRSYIDWLLSEVDLVLTISQAVQADLARHAATRGTSPAIGIVPLGANIEKAAPREPALTPRLEPDGFVIAVSTIQSRKNFDLLYRLWQRFADEGRGGIPRLVIVGARGFGSGDLLDQIARDPRVADSVLVLHDATDAELGWLYRNCRFTLYPSFAEGWGLPIAESLAYGKPCLASNTTSMPEAGAGFAAHLDPLDFRSWHDTILAWSQDEAALAAMAQRIAGNYRAPTWQQSAAALAAQLRGLTG